MKRQTGNGIAADALKFARQNQLLSRGLGYIPHPAGQVASFIARQAGYGKKKPRKRRVKPRVVQVGNGLFTDIGNGPGGLARGIGGGLFGGAKKRVRRTAIRA